MKICTVYGIKNNEKFRFKFYFNETDYLEQLCEQLEKVNHVTLEDVERIYIQDPKAKKVK